MVLNVPSYTCWPYVVCEFGSVVVFQADMFYWLEVELITLMVTLELNYH